MAKPLKQLIDRLPSRVDAEANVKAAQLLTAMNLAKLRKAKNITQNEIADLLDMSQPSIAQVEKRTDAYISTLQNYLHALGGELEITANFPDGTKVQINQFDSQ